MSRSIYYSLVTVLALVGFGVLMTLRTEPSSFAVRVAFAVLAGVCLGWH